MHSSIASSLFFLFKSVYSIYTKCDKRRIAALHSNATMVFWSHSVLYTESYKNRSRPCFHMWTRWMQFHIDIDTIILMVPSEATRPLRLRLQWYLIFCMQSRHVWFAVYIYNTIWRRCVYYTVHIIIYYGHVVILSLLMFCGHILIMMMIIIIVTIVNNINNLLLKMLITALVYIYFISYMIYLFYGAVVQEQVFVTIVKSISLQIIVQAN